MLVDHGAVVLPTLPPALAAILPTLPTARRAAIAARGKPAAILRCRGCATPLILAYRRFPPAYLHGADFALIAGERRVATTYCPACGAARVYTER